jgi:hypothetical protein
MRITCAVCDYLHDSTVTPFMYDIIPSTKRSPTGPNNLRYAKAVNAEFRCKKCGAKNDICLIWSASVTEKPEENKDVPEDTERIF